jgi:hypothetical protein
MEFHRKFIMQSPTRVGQLLPFLTKRNLCFAAVAALKRRLKNCSQASPSLYKDNAKFE